MRVFEWNSGFETGQGGVDTQHRRRIGDDQPVNSPPSFPLPFALPFALLLVFGCAGGGSSPDAGSDASAVDAGMTDASVTDSAVDAAPPPYDGGFAPRLVGDVSHPLDDVLRLNQLQAEGTHNSYHIRPEVYGDDWDYTMSPLGVQLADEGVRQIELDLHWDRLGHRWHVFHIGVADPLSTCDLFLDCLAEVRRFSDSHPGHHPIFIQIEPKEPFRASEIQEEMDAMEAEIELVLPPELLITPDIVRGASPDLKTAIADHGWPTLGEVRGRVLFFLNCSREWCVSYAHDGEGLDGRLIFADSEASDPWAAFRIINTPGPDVRVAAEAGYLVRTMAVSASDALAGNFGDFDLALRSGAHMISGDVPAPRDGISFFAEIPGGTPSRCNPITAPPECTSTDLEDPARWVPSAP